MTSPKILNLDELPTPASLLAIHHKGVDHTMVALTVEGFIDQQNRAAIHQSLLEKQIADGTAGVSDEEMENTQRKVVETIRDAVVSFFPTLPVNELEVTKLFSVFGWLNDMSTQVNADHAPESAEGNVEGEISSPS